MARISAPRHKKAVEVSPAGVRTGSKLEVPSGWGSMWSPRPPESRPPSAWRPKNATKASIRS